MRIARTDAEIDAAQALRYRVFFERDGCSAECRGAELSRRDRDGFDAVADHLLVVDHELGEGAAGVVGTYRLIQKEGADSGWGASTRPTNMISTPIEAFPGKVLELRAVVRG